MTEKKPDEESSRTNSPPETVNSSEPELAQPNIPEPLRQLFSPDNESPDGKLQGFLQVMAGSITRSGPLPPPGEVAEYEKILPGSADRILTMAETEQRHRHEIENQESQAAIRDSGRGVIYAFILGLVTIVGGVILGSAGSPFAGAFISAIGVGSLVGTFIYGTRSKISEAKQEKSAEHPTGH